MFSEYASKFLAQSQSRLVAQADPNDPNSRNPRSLSRLGSRYLQRPGMASPYQPSGSQLSRFPFAPRAPQPAAPLFYSATDEFREEDDGEERDREVADYYALQRSRRHFGASNISESDEMDETAENSRETGGEDNKDEDDRLYGLGRGIRSSWKGETPLKRGRPPAVEDSVLEQPEREHSRADSVARESSRSGKGNANLVDVELTQSENSSVDAMDREEFDDAPPAFQQFRTPPPRSGTQFEHTWLPRETDDETARLQPRPPSPDRESVPAGVTGDAVQVPRYDVFWATAFWIAFASMFGSAFLVWLHTDIPTGKNPIGDTIYTTLRKSYHLLGVDTLVAVIVATLWLALLRSFLRPMTYLIIIAVPVILFAFSLYPLISSFKGRWHGDSFQDKMMRLWSLLPSAGAFMWIYLFIKARHSVEQGLEILTFGCKVLAESPALILVGFASLAANIAWFWIWLIIFTRVFLEGHWIMGSKNLFVPDATSWWLGAFYFLMLMWTQSVISGVQRATSGATISQWYFHRLTNPAISSRTVVAASFVHAIGTLFGTICLSTFLSVMIRLPLLLLPRRLVGWFSLCFYSIVPSPIAALTNPLTLTYAAIHSQPLGAAARGLSSLSFVSTTSATTTLTPNAFSHRSNTRTDNLVPYRTAKLILHGTRYMMVLALGYGAWVATSRLLQIDGETYKGSLYAYVVGLGAAAIGWSILGATEGIILGVVDAVVVCWGSEVGALRGQGRTTTARYCREAGELFGEQKSTYDEV